MGTPSGRFVLRVTPELHRRLRDRAAATAVSLNALCARILEAGLVGPGAPVPRAAPGVDPGLLAAVAGEWAADRVGMVLFGSAARGAATAASDIDLLVVLEPGARIERALYDRWDGLVRARGSRADLRVAPQFVALPVAPEAAGGIWLEVAREGIVLDDRDGRLARFLIGLRDLTASGRVARKVAHGHPYWVREGRRR